MPADTLLAAERAHLLRLALWGTVSVAMGLVIWATLRARRRVAPLPLHFAIQTGAWGAVDLAICAAAWRTLSLRSAEAVVSLDRFLWFNIGLDAGYVAVGATLALVGWRLTRSRALVGAGLGVIVQGVALAWLDVILASSIARG